jgi:SAM-dependent methyltransferase
MENLDAMRAARNYNAHIGELIVRAAHLAPRRELAIDFGAGLGTFTGVVAPFFQRVVAVEVEVESAAQLQAQGYEVMFDLSSIPDASADFVFSVSVLEHIDDEAAVLKEIRRVLKPGGKLFVYVPAFDALWSEMDRLVGHRRRYTTEGLARRLNDAGLENARGRYVDSLGALASLVMRGLRFHGRLTAASVGAYDRWGFPASRLFDAALGGFFGKNVYLEAAAPGNGL